MCAEMLPLEKKALFILNPVAGRKLIQRNVHTVVRCLMDHAYLVTTAVTASRGEACELAARYGASFDLIVCAGGDGTLNECVNGMAREGISRPIGYIPCGSTNDFALTTDLPLDIQKAAAAVGSGRIREYDIGCFDERFFLHHALFGAFTRMAYTTQQVQKNLLGYGAYVLDGLRELPNLKPISLSVTVNGERREGEYLFGSFSTKRQIAGIYELPEDLIGPRDGKLAALFIKAPKSVADWELIARSLLSGDPNCPMVEILVSSDFLVQPQKEIEWSLDGESSGLRGTTWISVRQASLKLQG